MNVQVHLHGSVPATAVGITVLTASLLALILLGSSTAFNDVVSLSVAALFSSYIIAAALLLWRRCRGDIKEENDDLGGSESQDGVISFKLNWGPWRIRGWPGTANNALACAYLVVIFFFSFWPPENPPSAKSMNYSVLMLGATAIFSVLYYVLYARKTYKGPLVET